jgi:excisionase family DNA binding protein
MDPLILRIPDVAVRLGMPPSAVRHLVEVGMLPARKLGGKVVILPQELDEFIRTLPKRGDAASA